MWKGIIKIVMKNPIPAIITFIALCVPYGIALYQYNTESIRIYGISMIVGMRVLCASAMVMMWWGVQYTINS